MNIISSRKWGMPKLAANHSTRKLSTITEANIHHSDSPRPVEHAHNCAQQVLGFDRFHREKGWAAIGYNRVICPHGYVYQGRPRHVIPAAAEGHNSQIIAYCLIGNGNEPATDAQWKALLQVIEHDEKRIGHELQWTTHREVEPSGYTECPGDGIEKQVRQHRKGK